MADTIGVAEPDLIKRVVSAAQSDNPDVIGAREDFRSYELGVHLHSTRSEAVAKILGAYDAGCRRFDSAIGGLGGCPFAQDEMVGNIPTESVLEALQQRGLGEPIRNSIESVIAMNTDIGTRFA